MQRLTQWARLAFVLCGLGMAAAVSYAQATKGGEQHIDSRVDIYGGYGYFHPFNSGIAGFEYQSVYNPNATVGVSLVSSLKLATFPAPPSTNSTSPIARAKLAVSSSTPLKAGPSSDSP